MNSESLADLAGSDDCILIACEASTEDGRVQVTLEYEADY